MVNKQPEVTEQTRNRLKQAFWDLYFTTDLGKIRVKDITDKAGYNRATFYEYYKDIPELFSRAEDELLDALADLITTNLGNMVDGDFEGSMGALAATVRKYRSFMTVLLSERGDPKFVRKFKELITPLVNQGANDMRLKPAQARLFREFALAGTVAAVTAWLRDSEGMEISDFVQFMKDSFPPKDCATACIKGVEAGEDSEATHPAASLAA